VDGIPVVFHAGVTLESKARSRRREMFPPTREQIMPIADRRRSTVTTFAAAAAAVVVAIAFTVLACPPAPDAGSTALGIGTALPVPQPASSRQANHMAVDPLTRFLQRWTNTAEVNRAR
jgi:hypothetical protein